MWLVDPRELKESVLRVGSASVWECVCLGYLFLLASLAFEVVGDFFGYIQHKNFSVPDSLQFRTLPPCPTCGPRSTRNLLEKLQRIFFLNLGGGYCHPRQ